MSKKICLGTSVNNWLKQDVYFEPLANDTPTEGQVVPNLLGSIAIASTTNTPHGIHWQGQLRPFTDFIKESKEHTV